MDLYGSGASIAQANSQTEAARQINEATRDFNNSLAEQLDQANLEQDEDKASKLQKNILSGVTSGGKLITKRAAIKQGAKLGFKEVKTSLAERMARETGEQGLIRTAGDLEEAVRTLPEGVDEIGAERFAADVDPGALITESEVRNVGVPAEQATAEAASEGVENVAGAAAESAVETSEKSGLKETAKIIEKFGERATKIGKIGAAGLGGGMDAFQDIGRLMEGKTGWDTFGSNNASRVGNIGNIVGSALEVAGVATGGVTPISIALETVGAGISLVSSITEAGGELEAGEESKETEQEDITSQARGDIAADTVTQAVGRTQ